MRDTRSKVDAAAAVMADKLAEVPPRLRGWMHAGAIPLLTAAFAVLIVLSPTGLTTLGSSVYAASALLLFGVSALYHRGTWSSRTWAFLRRFDHANIYVFIAGTYTPFGFLYLDGAARAWLLGIVWGCALGGLVFRIAWVDAPRWLFTPLYIALGWIAVIFLPQVLDGADRFPVWVNVTVLALVATGGVLYTVGGLVYAAKRPNPSPTWFGFHEIFHLCTVLAFAAQYVAISIATYSLR
ncbi:PAQR family membrane homeostasis protein TrhA [Nocardioides sp.]|uniref:PAQR family membrane homeostasis protein TrhA n=1 Tax=Nocardioides sp. TaxID=35761 RepID=UPI002BD46761|nr:hemolysin III family protein [Nocardioides sp.]HSX66846.1 hemolysin III family protein [Nocardioides sp.]